ncbi:hypothetical protein [Pseudonocardia humida]|uniref:Uncharacterized protein n=1 Tax=Pseudonocardia humida TaxID=2800819 RepID=A0ABT1ADC7_9PSEU|nr:hypothetical protein [Pseudonocardia humida]MCO1661077.1 hypothetical protein [Pseudonocardia humida]
MTLSAVLTAARDTLTTLGILPVRFEADESGARVLAVMPDSALQERSTGPYRREEPPPEAMHLVRLISWRWSSRPERPDVTLGMAGPWPELALSLPESRVRIEYVVPEAAPPGWRPEPGHVTAEIDVVMALEVVARSLDAVGEPLPVRVSLDYPADPGYGTDPRSVLPVVPTLVLDRRRCPPHRRAAHNAALRAAAYADQPFDLSGGTAFRTWVGSARIQDLDP